MSATTQPEGSRPTTSVEPDVGAVAQRTHESSVDDGASRAMIHERDPSLLHKMIMAIAVGGPFLGFVVAIATLWSFGWMGWPFLGMLIVAIVMTALGVTIGFHRLLSHRSFATFRWVRAFWTAMGAMSIEGSPLVWVAVHRRHHEFSDAQGDPHSPHLHDHPLRGLIHAHFGWLFRGYWHGSNLQRYVPDLMRDPILVSFHNWYFVWVLISLGLPALIGGLWTMSWFGAWLGFLWGGLARVFFTQHLTWSINSICHVFGSREFETSDHSRNNLLFALLGYGEGWHNNHHAFPSSARHGLHWWQLDLSWLVIRGMQAVGLAWDVRTPTTDAMDRKREQS